MEVNKLINNSEFGKITAYIGDFKLDSGKILPNMKDDKTVEEYFLYICDTEKLKKALAVLDIKEDVVSYKCRDLSNSLKNKLAIVEALVSKENTFILENINKSLTYREIQNVKRILKKLTEHNKKIIIKTNDVEFLFGLTKEVYVVDNDSIKNLSPIDWFDDEVYKYVSKPLIIEFIMYCKERNIKLENALETKELLKAIYRSVDK